MKHARLNRHVQNKLGDTLRAMFDEIVQEGVPDHLALLLKRLEEQEQCRDSQQDASTETFPRNAKAKDVTSKG